MIVDNPHHQHEGTVNHHAEKFETGADQGFALYMRLRGLDRNLAQQ